MFTIALALVEALELAELKDELKKRINGYLKFDVLIIDELGYLPMHRQGKWARLDIRLFLGTAGTSHHDAKGEDTSG